MLKHFTARPWCQEAQAIANEFFGVICMVGKVAVKLCLHVQWKRIHYVLQDSLV